MEETQAWEESGARSSVPPTHLSPPQASGPHPTCPAVAPPPALQLPSPPAAGSCPQLLTPLHAHTALHFPGAPGPPEAPGPPPGGSAAQRGCSGGEARRAPGPRPAPCSLFGGPARARSDADLGMPRFRCQQVGALRTPPYSAWPFPARRPALLTCRGPGRFYRGRRRRCWSRLRRRRPRAPPRPRQGQPLPRPRPSRRQPLATTSPSAPPPLPVAGPSVTQWPNGAAYIFLPSPFPCIGVAAEAGAQLPHLAHTLRPERRQPREATKAPVSPQRTTWPPWPFLLALGPISWQSRRGDRSWL